MAGSRSQEMTDGDAPKTFHIPIALPQAAVSLITILVDLPCGWCVNRTVKAVLSRSGSLMGVVTGLPVAGPPRLQNRFAWLEDDRGVADVCRCVGGIDHGPILYGSDDALIMSAGQADGVVPLVAWYTPPACGLRRKHGCHRRREEGLELVDGHRVISALRVHPEDGAY